MGISFKVSKTGKRFRLNPPPFPPPSPSPTPSQATESIKQSVAPSKLPSPPPQVAAFQETGYAKGLPVSSVPGEDHEVSFTLYLLPDGFFIGKPTEVAMLQALLKDLPKSLHPYNRIAVTLLSSIESGCLPGDIFDDIPSKYYNGTLMCEVRDYRKSVGEGNDGYSMDGFPSINKVLLRMSFENVVKDIPTISDDSWTYGDLMEVESRILKVLQPKLHLDPSPMLDRLSFNNGKNKLNLVNSGGKRKRELSVETTAAYARQSPGKIFCKGRISDANIETCDSRAISSNATVQHHYQSMTVQNAQNAIRSLGQDGSTPVSLPVSQTQFQSSVGFPRVNQDRFSMNPTNYNLVNSQVPLVRNNMTPYSDAMVNRKRENHEMHQTGVTELKRKQTLVGKEVNQHLGHHGEGPTGADIRWKNGVLPQQMDAKEMQYAASVTGQKYLSPVTNDISNPEGGSSFYLNQSGTKNGIKQEYTETDKLDRQESEKFRSVHQMHEAEGNLLDHQLLRSQQTNQHSFMKANLASPQQWHNLTSSVDKNARKDDMLQKRKQSNSPRVSAIPPIQSPIPTKSGDMSTGSLNGQFGTVTAASSFGSQKEKPSTISNAALCPTSVTSSLSDSLQRQAQSKRKANSFSKAHAMSGVASPASVSNISAQLNASSPSVISASNTDTVMLERFAKIEMITQRFQLNVDKNKVENFSVKKPMAHSTEEISKCLSSLAISEDFEHPEWPMSRSLIGGTMNNCKTRILAYGRPSSNFHGHTVKIWEHRVLMNEKPIDGTVIMWHGDGDGSDYHSQDCLVALSSTHYADLLGAQLKSLVEREGYEVHDQTALMNISCGNPSIGGTHGDNSVSELPQQEVVHGQQPNQGLFISNSGDATQLRSQNLPNATRMLPPGSSLVSTMPQGYLQGGSNMTVLSARSQQVEQTLLQHQQTQHQQMQQHQMQSHISQQSQQAQLQQHSPSQLQHSQLHRPSSILQINPLTHLMGQNSSMPLSGSSHLMSSKSQLQIQTLQQQSQFPRKPMMGLGAMNIGSSIMGLGSLNNVMGVSAGVRGIPSPITSLSGLSNIASNQINLASASNFGVGLHPGNFSTAQANQLAKMRMSHGRGLYGAQPGTSLPGSNNQMLQTSVTLSTLGSPIFRPNMSSPQRNSMSSMGPPKMPASNIYMNQQQLQIQQQLQQQQQQQQLQQQQQQQQLPQQQHHQQQQQLKQQQQLLQQQQQLLQQQQLQQQQQQIGSPLQQSQVNSPPITCSPAAAIQQQQISPQQLTQQVAMSPQQLSGGTLQPANNGSPQLSSQTHGSVGSISSSPMDQLQGANKGGSVNTG